MKHCPYCGRENEDTANVCRECRTNLLQYHFAPAQDGTKPQIGTPKTSWRRGIKFLVGGLLGGTVLVVILSAAFQDWSYLSRWVTAVAGIGLVTGYELGRGWLIMRAIRLAELQCGSVVPKQRGDA